MLNKGIATVVAIVIGIIGVTAAAGGLAVAASYSKAPPGTALYGLRSAGDAIRCAFSSDKRACFENFAQEREQQARELQDTQPDVARQLREDAQNIRRSRGVSTIPETPTVPRP